MILLQRMEATRSGSCSTTAVDALEHKFHSVTNGLDTLTDTHRASQAVEQVLATLAQIRPASARRIARLLREQQMLGRIARQFHLPEEQLRNRLTALRRDRSSAVRPARAATPIESTLHRPKQSPARRTLGLGPRPVGTGAARSGVPGPDRRRSIDPAVIESPTRPPDLRRLLPPRGTKASRSISAGC